MRHAQNKLIALRLWEGDKVYGTNYFPKTQVHGVHTVAEREREQDKRSEAECIRGNVSDAGNVKRERERAELGESI